MIENDSSNTPSHQDEAARAGWLYYVGRLTQDQIAREMGVSRQRAQRLVSRAMSDGLIRVRLDHRLSECFELEVKLKQAYGLKLARVAPSLPGLSNQLASVAPLAAEEMERQFAEPQPRVFAFGTGRTLRATIEELRAMECEQHKMVSLIGNIAPDGSASFFDVIMRIADKIRAPHYPMPVPVIAASEADKAQFLNLDAVKNVISLARKAHVAFVGIGQMDDTAPLLKDGFITRSDMTEIQTQKAVGEIVSWSYNSDGTYFESGYNSRICGVKLEPNSLNLSIGIVAELSKLAATRAALKGKLINGLITDELTAIALLG